MEDRRGFLPGKQWAFPVTALIIAWAILISQTQYHWGGESYYNFGWFVPFMAVWLFLRNYAGLAPSTPQRPGVLLLLAGLCVTAALPFHALSEVNPFWRLPLWLQGGCYFGFSLVVVHGMFGWRGVRRAVFPLFFLTTMIPWPYRMEVLIIQMLTKVVVVLAMQGLHFLGYPVELAGNSFVLGDLNIGVNEACSGIRSLQALFMVTLFLGSLFGQGWARRLAAVVILPAVVVLVNTGRAIFLALQLIENGQHAYDEWHDPAGYIAFGVSMVLIYTCIEIFNIGAARESAVEPGALAGLWRRLRELRLPRSVMALPLLPVLMYLAVEGWFLYHEARSTQGYTWELVAPAADDPSIQMEPIHPQIELALGYDYGVRFFKTLSRRAWAEVYYYGYTPHNKLASVSSYGHSPTICMQSTGATMKEQFPDILIQVKDGPTLVLKHYLFQLGSSPNQLHVFWTVWEHRNMNIEHEQLQSLDYRTQLLQLLKGRRDFSRQVLLMSLTGMDNPAEARRTLRELLSEWLAGQRG